MGIITRLFSSMTTQEQNDFLNSDTAAILYIRSHPSIAGNSRYGMTFVTPLAPMSQLISDNFLYFQRCSDAKKLLARLREPGQEGFDSEIKF